MRSSVEALCRTIMATLEVCIQETAAYVEKYKMDKED